MNWTPPAPPTSEADGEISAVDPRVIATHSAGAPCPKNPPPPDGYSYWQGGKVSKFQSLWCASILKIPSRYPMGSFVQVFDKDQIHAARVEWHSIQGGTGKRGVFRGVNLMRRAK